jgi:hypothetical protein
MSTLAEIEMAVPSLSAGEIAELEQFIRKAIPAARDCGGDEFRFRNGRRGIPDCERASVAQKPAFRFLIAPHHPSLALSLLSSQDAVILAALSVSGD